MSRHCLGSIVLLLPAAVRGAPEARDFGAVFSPDGKTVAFVHAVGGIASIDLIDRDGSHRRALVRRVGPQHLAWSPDGRSLAYDSGASIWRVDLATGDAGAADHRRREQRRRKLAAVLVAGRKHDRLLALPDLLPLHRDLADRQRRHLAAPDLRHLPGPPPDVLARRHEARALARKRPRDRPRWPPDRRRRRRVHDLVATRHLRCLHRRRPLDPQPPHRHRTASDATHRRANRLVAGRERGSPAACAGRSPSFARETGRSSRSSRRRTSAAAPRASRTASSSTRTPASAASTSPAKTARTRDGSHEPADTAVEESSACIAVSEPRAGRTAWPTMDGTGSSRRASRRSQPPCRSTRESRLPRRLARGRCVPIEHLPHGGR